MKNNIENETFYSLIAIQETLYNSMILFCLHERPGSQDTPSFILQSLSGIHYVCYLLQACFYLPFLYAQKWPY